ncbi:MAG: hypothetical protein ACUVTR_07580 [Dehalococcoidia bacterium]
MANTPPPTPTPLLGGNIFFEPSRVSAETRAIEVVIVNLTRQQVPVVEHSIVITEPTTLREITATLLATTSTTCATTLPTSQQRRGYGINLYLYSQREILPLSATSGQWMLASISYYPEVNYIGVYRPDGQGGRIIEFCPVGMMLREILERELVVSPQ